MDTGPLIVIVGETASGKSALAMRLARKFNGEIISADSWQVYKGFDIGTAKPSKAERSEIPHHLLDIADPAQGFNAAEFKKLAKKSIEQIHSQNKLPIVVGGTGLYVDSLIYNYSFLSAGTERERARLNKLTIQDLLKELKARKISLEGIDTRNKRRLVRLLEVDGQRPAKAPLRTNTLIIGLQTNRDKLKQLVTKRVDTMLKTGLEEEVGVLANQYGWDVEPMKGIGYRDWKDYFAGIQSLEQTRERIINSSMGLAKKQRTWFKRNNSIHWTQHQAKAVELVTTFLNKLDVQ